MEKLSIYEILIPAKTLAKLIELKVNGKITYYTLKQLVRETIQKRLKIVEDILKNGF